jgi:hypothetical protein
MGTKRRKIPSIRRDLSSVLGPSIEACISLGKTLRKKFRAVVRQNISRDQIGTFLGGKGLNAILAST